MARLLVVDDDHALRQLVEAILLEDRTHAVRGVARADEALVALETFAADRLIVDVRLPDMDGPSLYREARRRGFGGRVLVFTANDRNSPALKQVEEELGHAGIMFKPFDIDALIERVNLLLQLPREV